MKLQRRLTASEGTTLRDDAESAGLLSVEIEQGHRLSKTDWFAVAAAVVLCLIAIAAPLVAPYGVGEQAAAPFTEPSSSFLMGTDGAGRDVFSRVLLGLRNSLAGAAVVVASGVAIGGVVGIVAGIRGGWVDEVLMRVTDMFLAMPGPVLAIAVVSAIGPSYSHLLLAVAIVWWPLYARVLRGETKALMSRPHMEAARLGGLSRLRLMRRHVAPGLVPATLVLASLDIGALVLTLGGLSFLGLGAPSPAPELGAMAAQGMPYLFSAWWVPVGPAAALLLVATIANLAGDTLRDRLGVEG